MHPPTWLLATAILAAFGSLLPTTPPVFQRVLVILTRYRHLRLPKELARAMSWRLVASGWFLLTVGWLFMGTSLWFLCEAIRLSMDLDPSAAANISLSSLKLWWISVAASCLGFVIGFLTMLPGGAGVREVVVTMLLAPAIGYAPALTAAVLYRLANLIAELIVAGITWYIAEKMSWSAK
jgi:uncharacterized membrane protein YbhN (UPF0104 family)